MGEDAIERDDMDPFAEELVAHVKGPVRVAVAAKRAVHAAITGRWIEVGMQHQAADMGGLSGPVPFVGYPAIGRRTGGSTRAQRGAGRLQQRWTIGVVETGLEIKAAVVPGVNG